MQAKAFLEKSSQKPNSRSLYFNYRFPKIGRLDNRVDSTKQAFDLNQIKPNTINNILIKVYSLIISKL